MVYIHGARMTFACRHVEPHSPTAPDQPLVLPHSPGTSYSKEAVMAALQATGRCPHCGCSMGQIKMIKNAMLRKVGG